MKIPLQIHPARVPYDQRDLIPVRLIHVFFAVLLLTLTGLTAYTLATLIFQIPN